MMRFNMNVQELIDELQKIDNKTMRVIVSMGNETSTGLKFNRGDAISIGEIRGEVWIANEFGQAKFFR